MKAFVPFLVLPLFVSSLAAQNTKLTDFEAIEAYDGANGLSTIRGAGE